MTTTLDARPHAAAIKAAIKANLGPNEVYDYDDVPGTNGNAGVIPDRFALISVEPLEPPPLTRRMSGQTAVRRWMLTVRGVGRTIDEARWVLARANEALYEQILTIEGVVTEPLQPQSGQAPDKDDGRYSGLLIFTYGH